MSGEAGFLRCPAPAKLNLFLHVVGRRPDGYHLLQSAFRLLDWCDWLEIRVREDGEILRARELPGVSEAADLTLRAARLLKEATGTCLGVEIAVEKHLPMGGGLGGGSSDAATVLMALNRVWDCGMSREALQVLGLQLGADVPFFIYGRDAFVEGVGERFQPIELPPAWYVIVSPGVEIPTSEIFGDEGLTRNTPPIRIADFALSATRNDLQPVAGRRYPGVKAAIDWLSGFYPARMTGSGACVFAEVPGEREALDVLASCPSEWRVWVAKSLAVHPLA